MVAIVLANSFDEFLRVRTRFHEVMEVPNRPKSTQFQAAIHMPGHNLLELEGMLNHATSWASETLGIQYEEKQVFICHNTKDKAFVKKLASDLRQAKLKVWYDAWTMLPGDSLYDKIQQGIRTSAWFIIVLSPDAVSSQWCKRELHNALEEELERKSVYVIPVLYRSCEIPGFLKEKLWADCRGNKYKKGLSSLLERLRA